MKCKNGNLACTYQTRHHVFESQSIARKAGRFRGKLPMIAIPGQSDGIVKIAIAEFLADRGNVFFRNDADRSLQKNDHELAIEVGAPLIEADHGFVDARLERLEMLIKSASIVFVGVSVEERPNQGGC